MRSDLWGWATALLLGLTVRPWLLSLPVWRASAIHLSISMHNSCFKPNGGNQWQMGCEHMWLSHVDAIRLTVEKLRLWYPVCALDAVLFSSRVDQRCWSCGTSCSTGKSWAHYVQIRTEKHLASRSESWKLGFTKDCLLFLVEGLKPN